MDTFFSSGREIPVQAKAGSGGKRISSGATFFWKDLFPWVWTIGVGIGMLGVWYEWFGEPASMEVKLLGMALWAGTSVLFRLGTKRLQEVWLEDGEVIVLAAGRRTHIPLREVTEVRESRGQKIKTIKLRLRRPSAVGQEIRFIPVHRFQAPFTDHPVVQELREMSEELSMGRNPDQPRLP